MRDPRYERRRRAAVPAALAAFMLLVVASGARTPPTWAGGSPFTPAMTIVLPAQQVAVAPADAGLDEPPSDPVPLAGAGDVAAVSTGTGDTGGSDGDGGAAGGDGDDQTTEPAIRHVFVVMLSETDLVALAGADPAARDTGTDPTAAPGTDADPAAGPDPDADPAARDTDANPAAAPDPDADPAGPDPDADPAAAPASTFAGELVPQGTLLTAYASVARGSLANGVALLSGQGPTAQTLADCPTAAGTTPADVTPDVLGDDGQQLGDGCVYPFATGTMPDQLVGAGLDWRAYVEDAEGACPATPRNPFASFHSLLDTGACARRVAGLDRLAADLARGADAPALLYVVPGACHDGRATPCAPGAPSGAAAADAFLADVIPQILTSAAYADGGLIAITSDGPPPPAQPAPAPTPPPADTTPPPTPPLPPPGQTTPTTTTSAAGRTTPSAAASAAADGPVPAAYPNVGDAAGAGAARVGALLISPSVPAGRRSAAPANHFTLLRAISDLFALQPLGYAGAAGLAPLPERVLRRSER